MFYSDKYKRFVLTPAEKCSKYTKELHDGYLLTINGTRVKNKKNGRPIKLRNTQLSWRSGYMKHVQDSNKIFRARHPNYVRKTKS